MRVLSRRLNSSLCSLLNLLLLDRASHGASLASGAGTCASIVNPTHTAGATSLPSSLTHAHIDPAHAFIGTAWPRYVHNSGVLLTPSGNENFLSSTPTHARPSAFGCDFDESAHGNSALMRPVTHGPLPLPFEPLYTNSDFHHAASTWPARISHETASITFAAHTAAPHQPALTRPCRLELLKHRVNFLHPRARLNRPLHPRVGQNEKARAQVAPIRNRAQKRHFGDAATCGDLVSAREWVRMGKNCAINANNGKFELVGIAGMKDCSGCVELSRGCAREEVLKRAHETAGEGGGRDGVGC